MPIRGPSCCAINAREAAIADRHRCMCRGRFHSRRVRPSVLCAARVATQDLGDNGPFRSIVYLAGRIEPDASEPVQVLPETNASWVLDGLKVEALGPSAVERSLLSIATDDENYEGVWRPLFDAPMVPSPKPALR